MSLVLMEIESVVVGNDSTASMLVLRRQDASSDPASSQLPIRIGTVEASQISAGVTGSGRERPMTHDLLAGIVVSLGAKVTSVSIDRVVGTIFYANVHLRDAEGKSASVDARPSDAIALAVRAHVPVYADTSVLSVASYPSFEAIKRQEQEREFERFHEFVESLSPDDFLDDGKAARDAGKSDGDAGRTLSPFRPHMHCHGVRSKAHGKRGSRRRMRDPLAIRCRTDPCDLARCQVRDIGTYSFTSTSMTCSSPPMSTTSSPASRSPAAKRSSVA